MNLGLDGKTALVTGASKGIGLAIAKALAQEGCRVALTARGREALEQAALEIESGGGDARAFAADVTKPDDVQRLMDDTVSAYGTVHILVNNTGGIGRFATFEELSDDEWLDVLNLNIMSAVMVTRAALPLMKAQKWGRIINIASESGIQPDAAMPHYNASKAALINLTKSLSKAYGGDGILVNTVSPAFIMTPLVEQMLDAQAQQAGISRAEAEAQFLKENRPNIVLKRAGTSEETAALVAFLASDQASFITGSNFRVDGGSVASV